MDILPMVIYLGHGKTVKDGLLKILNTANVLKIIIMKLSEQEINEKLGSLEGWTFNDNSLQTSFEFENFKEAFTLMTRIAFEAEAQSHHPDWNNVYNQLEISLSTHDAGGVTEKDFKLAKAIEGIVNAE
jgi:4a-hydroxytetrahydrobiopterin dehydratase